MKNSIVAFFAIISTIGFFACSKSGNKAVTVQPNAMKGTVNGKAWNAICYARTWKNYNDDNFIIITSGDTSVYPYIEVSIPLDTEMVRTMKIYDADKPSTWNGMKYVAHASIDSSNSQYTSSCYGTLTITQKTPDIIGSISFTCLDSTKVTASFKCKTP